MFVNFIYYFITNRWILAVCESNLVNLGELYVTDLAVDETPDTLNFSFVDES